MIFDNIDKAVEKLANLRKRPEFSDATALDLVEFGENIYTVGFSKLIDRAAIMLNITEFLSGHPLRKGIDALTIYRNKIVHFTVDVDVDEIVSILADLLDPFLSLLQREVKDIEFKNKCIPLIRKSAKSLSEIYLERHRGYIISIEKILEKFNKQTVSGKLFGLNGKIKLPKFQEFQREYRNNGTYVSLIAKSAQDTWLIDIHDYGAFLGYIRNSARDLLLTREKFNDPNIKLWMVFVKTPKLISGQKHLREKNIMFSSSSDIARIEEIF